MDAVFLKMKSEGHVRNVALYTIIGINLDGQKECLGLWICETESSKYWLSVLNELKNRGLEDVLIFSVDNLKGISEAIEAVYPQAEIATFFKYPPEVRTLIYTTNPIESLHKKIKKVSKNKTIFPNEQALFKLVYLAVEEAAKKWTMRQRDWGYDILTADVLFRRSFG
jgi:transposase-like protein